MEGEHNVLDRMIGLLTEEMPEYKEMPVPHDLEGKRRLFRSLCNVRPPIPAREEFLRLEAIYLEERKREKTIIAPKDLWPLELLGEGKGVICLWRGDITALSADAIVDAANSQLLGCFVPCHKCVDNAIHSAAGVGLRLACAKIMKEQGHEEPVGCAKITPAFHLPSAYVIHTVGPVILGNVTDEDRKALGSCYKACLEAAEEKGLKSVAFCCISTGEFRFPAKEAARIAIETVRETARIMSVKQVIFNVFTETDEAIYRKLLNQPEG